MKPGSDEPARSDNSAKDSNSADSCGGSKQRKIQSRSSNRALANRKSAEESRQRKIETLKLLQASVENVSKELQELTPELQHLREKYEKLLAQNQDLNAKYNRLAHGTDVHQLQGDVQLPQTAGGEPNHGKKELQHTQPNQTTSCVVPIFCASGAKISATTPSSPITALPLQPKSQKQPGSEHQTSGAAPADVLTRQAIPAAGAAISIPLSSPAQVVSQPQGLSHTYPRSSMAPLGITAVSPTKRPAPALLSTHASTSFTNDVLTTRHEMMEPPSKRHAHAMPWGQLPMPSYPPQPLELPSTKPPGPHVASQSSPAVHYAPCHQQQGLRPMQFMAGAGPMHHAAVAVLTPPPPLPSAQVPLPRPAPPSLAPLAAMEPRLPASSGAPVLPWPCYYNATGTPTPTDGWIPSGYHSQGRAAVRPHPQLHGVHIDQASSMEDELEMFPVTLVDVCCSGECNLQGCVAPMHTKNLQIGKPRDTPM